MKTWDRESIASPWLALALNAAATRPVTIVVDPERYLPTLVCELVARYEEVLNRTKPARTELLHRKLVEWSRFNSCLIPLCPRPEDHELLPEEDIDCVACVLDCDLNLWSFSCYSLRVQARPGLITIQLYLGTTPKLGGIIPMQIRNILYLLMALMTANSGSSQRPEAPDEKAQRAALEAAGQISHVVESALEQAVAPLMEISAHDRLKASLDRKAEDLPVNTSPRPKVQKTKVEVEANEPADEQSPVKKVRRREEEK